MKQFITWNSYHCFFVAGRANTIFTQVLLASNENRKLSCCAPFQKHAFSTAAGSKRKMRTSFLSLCFRISSITCWRSDESMKCNWNDFIANLFHKSEPNRHFLASTPPFGGMKFAWSFTSLLKCSKTMWKHFFFQSEEIEGFWFVSQVIKQKGSIKSEAYRLQSVMRFGTFETLWRTMGQKKLTA